MKKIFISFFILLNGIILINCYAKPIKPPVESVKRDSTYPIKCRGAAMMQIDTTSQHLISKGHFVEVYADKTIYRSNADMNFLMKFTIKNISNKTIGVNLTDSSKGFYPNQWGFSSQPYRTVVDEEQIIPAKIIDTASILKKFKDVTLTMVEPNQVVVYYRAWNGTGEKIDSKSKEKYLIISFDGQLLLTNGIKVENLTLLNAKEKDRVMVLKCPVNEKIIIEQ